MFPLVSAVAGHFAPTPAGVGHYAVGDIPLTKEHTMEPGVTAEAQQVISDISARYGLSQDAVVAMLYAVNSGGGTMAQFNIPELGGSGQWMRGGMTMVGDMFNNGLKARVDGLCNELSQLLNTTQVFPPAATTSTPFGYAAPNTWWPADLGVPSSSGGQNDSRYAVFPATRRLATQVNGVVRVFDTGEHQIGGVQQQQSGPPGTVSFTSQFGTFDTTSLRELGVNDVAATPTAAPEPRHAAPEQFDAAPQQFDAAPQQFDAPQQYAPAPDSSATSPAPAGSDAIIAAIEQLAGLHQRGILSDDEFSAKKAELLGRL